MARRRSGLRARRWRRVRGYCIAPDVQCLPVPRSVELVPAGAIPETFFTVFTNVFERGRLRAGETFLVHGGASGIGTTAIQMAHAFGARVFATAGSQPKCDACEKLGAQRAINYKADDFVVELMKITAGRGIDVILDMVGAEYFAAEPRFTCARRAAVADRRAPRREGRNRSGESVAPSADGHRLDAEGEDCGRKRGDRARAGACGVAAPRGRKSAARHPRRISAGAGRRCAPPSRVRHKHREGRPPGLKPKPEAQSPKPETYLAAYIFEYPFRLFVTVNEPSVFATTLM